MSGFVDEVMWIIFMCIYVYTGPQHTQLIKKQKRLKTNLQLPSLVGHTAFSQLEIYLKKLP